MELIKAGNRYSFACELCRRYPEQTSDLGLKASEYDAWVDFNKHDGIYTVWCKNGDKHFFDCEMNFIGWESY